MMAHDCDICGQACYCDGDDTWLPTPGDCAHRCACGRPCAECEGECTRDDAEGDDEIDEALPEDLDPDDFPDPLPTTEDVRAPARRRRSSSEPAAETSGPDGENQCEGS